MWSGPYHHLSWLSGFPSVSAVAAGAVSYCTIHGQTYKRDVLFCYDLDLPRDFQPSNTGKSITCPVLLLVPLEF